MPASRRQFFQYATVDVEMAAARLLEAARGGHSSKADLQKQSV
jgi:hypothetical protein